MTEQSTGVKIETASVTDRGLNERRPLNEDSMLCDPAHSIFAVADGVGGAEAGEVASQTAIEVLGEAFRHHAEGDDAEDLLEIAIQRANDSIYRLSREQPRFSMMATTVVALHLEGLRATIAHVGDSRLYRLTPAGELRRETEDHSLVEEEVRAGRLTAEQAANHPSRNVINRALGAEAAVEVDTKTVEVEPGTTFLICSDGITRHIPDEELGPLLASVPNLEAACAELKRLCYERGAEDNLTAVLVRVGGAGRPADDLHDTEEMPTLVTERAHSAAAKASADESLRGSILNRPFNDAGRRASADGEDASAAAASRAAPADTRGPSADRPPPQASGGAGRVVGVLLLLLAVGAAAFYGGLLFARRGGGSSVSTTGPTPAATSTPAAALTSAPVPTSEDDFQAAFDRRRRAVDLAPAAEASSMTAAAGGQPLNSQDPEFLYLYGRAMLLTDRQDEAIAAFNRAVQRIEENMTPRHGQLKIDARLATIAAHLRAGHTEEARGVAVTLDELIRAGNADAGASPSPTPE